MHYPSLSLGTQHARALLELVRAVEHANAIESLAVIAEMAHNPVLPFYLLVQELYCELHHAIPDTHATVEAQSKNDFWKDVFKSTFAALQRIIAIGAPH